MNPGVTQPLRVGVVGAGNVAQIAQLPVLAQAPDIRITGVVTATARSAEAALRRWPIEGSFSSVPELLAAGGLDALFVLTPRMVHEEQVEVAVRAGIPVYCEKPLATTAAAAHRLADLADERHVCVQVGFNRRHAPVYQQAHRQARDTGVQFAVAQKNRTGSEYRATFENAIHMLDLLRWFCGEPEPGGVIAFAAGSDPYQEDGALATIRFRSGAVATLVAARRAGEWDERLELYGGDTTVRVHAPELIDVVRAGTTNRRELRPARSGWATATETLGFQAAVLDFLASVRTGSTPLVTAREAARTQDLVEAVLQAADLPTSEQPGRQWHSHAQP